MGKQKGPYIVALVSDDKHALRPREWTYLEKLFAKHPELCRVECPSRTYPDI